MNSDKKLSSNKNSVKDIIDLVALVPEMIDKFLVSIESEYQLNNFEMNVDEDGITLLDKNGSIYELNTSNEQFFKNNQGKIVQINEGIVKPEFEVNTHNLIFTLYAKDIHLRSKKEEHKNQTPNKESVNARFKVFDMENNKDDKELYKKSYVIKKALVRKHSESQVTQQGNNLWIAFTTYYKQQQQQLEEEQQKQLKQQEAKNKKNAEKEAKQGDQESEDKKQQFKTPSKQTKTPSKIPNKQEEAKPNQRSRSVKKNKQMEEELSKSKKNEKQDMEIEENENEDQKESVEGAVSVAKEKQIGRREHLVQEQRSNLNKLYEMDIKDQQKPSSNKKSKSKTIQMEGVEYEAEEDEEESEEESEDENQIQKNKSPTKNKVPSSTKRSAQKGEKENKDDEKQNKNGVISLPSAQMDEEMKKSQKKKSIEKMLAQREQQEKKEKEQQLEMQKQQEQSRKLKKLHENHSKKDILCFIMSSNFEKKSEVRNAVLPRDPLDENKFKQYSYNVTKYIESQYK